MEIFVRNTNPDSQLHFVRKFAKDLVVVFAFHLAETISAPTLTTRHASLVPVSAEALQRERRQMQAKHLWYNLDIRWVDLKDKLEVLAPTGLTRNDIWRHLFLMKQRKNPYEEGCYCGFV